MIVSIDELAIERMFVIDQCHVKGNVPAASTATAIVLITKKISAKN